MHVLDGVLKDSMWTIVYDKLSIIFEKLLVNILSSFLIMEIRMSNYQSPPSPPPPSPNDIHAPFSKLSTSLM